ncbi:MAG: NIPSNAP family containing protein [Nitrososphaerales archaeon]
MAREFQLRIYKVKKGEMDELIKEWRENVCPLRVKFGFKVAGAWKIDSESRFVWMLEWNGPGTFQEADRAYYSSPERAAMKPDPTRHLEKVETHIMSSVD